jgi:hypothetical protein
MRLDKLAYRGDYSFEVFNDDYQFATQNFHDVFFVAERRLNLAVRFNLVFSQKMLIYG